VLDDVKSFNFGPNIFHKGKGDGVSYRVGRRQVRTVGIDSKRSSEGGVGNRAGEEKGRTTIAAATK